MGSLEQGGFKNPETFKEGFNILVFIIKFLLQKISETQDSTKRANRVELLIELLQNAITQLDSLKPYSPEKKVEKVKLEISPEQKKVIKQKVIRLIHSADDQAIPRVQDSKSKRTNHGLLYQLVNSAISEKIPEIVKYYFDKSGSSFGKVGGAILSSRSKTEIIELLIDPCQFIEELTSKKDTLSKDKRLYYLEVLLQIGFTKEDFPNIIKNQNNPSV